MDEAAAALVAVLVLLAIAAGLKAILAEREIQRRHEAAVKQYEADKARWSASTMFPDSTKEGL